MGTIRPPTRTPGSIKLIYQQGDMNHRLSVNLLAGQDINDIAVRRQDAIDLATRCQGTMTNQGKITGWAIFTRPQAGIPAQEVYAEGFPVAYIGSKGSMPGTVDYASFTLTLTGAGIPGAVGYVSGQTRLEMFPGNIIALSRRQRHQGVSAVIGLDTLANYLRSSTHVWADFYGQKCSVRGNAPVQLNAAVQRRYGC